MAETTFENLCSKDFFDNFILLFFQIFRFIQNESLNFPVCFTILIYISSYTEKLQNVIIFTYIYYCHAVHLISWYAGCSCYDCHFALSTHHLQCPNVVSNVQN